MATPLIAASTAALGVYIYLKQRSTPGALRGMEEMWWPVERPPEGWGNSIFYLTDVFRCASMKNRTTRRHGHRRT